MRKLIIPKSNDLPIYKTDLAAIVLKLMDIEHINLESQ